jgi:putative ABC transport system permease protein
MGVLIRIAFRNLMEHKSKSLIIGLIVAVGVLVIIVGNSFLNTADRGVKKAFTQNFTGDIYVYGKDPGKVVALPPSILFGSMLSGNQDAETPLLPDYQNLKSYIDSRSDVRRSAGINSVIGMFSLEDKTEIGMEGKDAENKGEAASSSMIGGGMLMGVEPENYRALFDNVDIVQGHYLEPGETGIMLAENRLKLTSKLAGTDIKLGDEIIVQGLSAGGMQARKLPIVGVFKLKEDSEAAAFLTYADVDSVRLLSNLTLGGSDEIALPDSARALLDMDEEDIFGADETVSSGSSFSSMAAIAQEAVSSPKVEAAADDGAWQFILVSLKNPAFAAATLRSLNAYFLKNHINAGAGDWKAAASPFSSSIDLVRFVLFIVILILVVVAVVIIMNTLVVSVIERTGEIGTMRALGAQKSYIWKMLITETLCVTLVFGVIGIGLSALAMGIVNLIGFKASNSFLQILFGGPKLLLSMTPGVVGLTLVLVAVVSLLAHIYPVMVALRVQPVQAMQAE